MSQWSTLKNRAAGKWQIPLFLLSVVLLAGAILRFQPNPSALPFERAVEHLDSLISGRLFSRVIEVGHALLEVEQRTDSERASLRLRMARAVHGQALAAGIRTNRVGRRIFEHLIYARSHGATLGVEDLQRLGNALEWQGQIDTALEYYGRAIDGGIKNPSDLRKRIILLAQRQPGVRPEHLNQLLDTLLAELEDHRLDLRAWAIEQKLEVLDRLDRLDEAATLVLRDRERFHETDLWDRFSFLEALVMFKRGDVDEAEVYLRTIRNRIDREDPVYAMTGWLLGRAVLHDGGPQRPLEALSFFTDVLNYHPRGPYAVASRLGAAEALAYLQRHEEAIDAYRIVVRESALPRGGRLVDPAAVRLSLSVMADLQRLGGQLEAALGYARLAATLLDLDDTEQATLFLQQLAQLQSLRAEEVERQSVKALDGNGSHAAALKIQSQELYAQAGSTYTDLAQVNIVNEKVAAQASLKAAQLYAQAGQLDRAAQLYDTFATERPAHTLVPRALFRIGQLRQALGELPEAIEAYQRCYRRFPRTLDGARALVPLSQCYLALGPEYDELAEKTLDVVLGDSEVFTPAAPEFADALFILGDLLNRRGSPERAIATLEETLERYPDDPRVWRARFLLADSYRRSALALRADAEDASYAGELQQMQEEAEARFVKARGLYHELIDKYEQQGSDSLNRLEQLYLRHASLYEADCFFETREYRQALKLYEEAAGTFKDTLSALSSYIQIINCHVFLGHPREAKAALARALIMVDSIPRQVFDDSVSPETQTDWRRYFEWLGESKLF